MRETLTKKAGSMNMRIIIAGLGAGDCGLITMGALDEARRASVIIVPRSRSDAEGMAERIIAHYLPDIEYITIVFPMTRDETKRQSLITSQLQAIMSKLKAADTIFYPVIGDVMLYSTGKYFLDAMRSIVPDIEIEFIPGVSAHSLAASCAKRFLAMDDEIFAVIPGTASPSRIRATLETCDSAAIYKPTAIHDIHELLRGFEVMRIDYAGYSERESITYGHEALHDLHYFSIILLWRSES